MSDLFTPEPRPTPLRKRASLTFDDAVLVWKLRALGESQHHIAQRFGVNPGRVSEVLKNHKHVGSRKIAAVPAEGSS